ncbi:pentapeptide repeat-containing protein [Noviherbaspirillum sp.]|uniref:pentapeptide repeat-containing protein n=1 Tax=Noviherbaspirillum sp. TaxID=1926288 RepID=UPI002D525A75|nr:pentapeptide repeat-containing protein [Noviherbaspirillum sp.]HZW19830.1 pentapeptide repeat-containing protein [Noviherbaspirillum sp.]
MMKLNTYVSQHNPNNQQVPHRQILGKQEFITELKEGRKNFPGVDLSGLRLSNMDSEFDLSGCNFSGANLRKCIITDCELDGTDFSGADLSNAELRGCTGIGTMMDATCLENVLFEECNLYASSFENARLGNGNVRLHLHALQLRKSGFEQYRVQELQFRGNRFPVRERREKRRDPGLRVP